jgi:hypothetical protein
MDDKRRPTAPDRVPVGAPKANRASAKDPASATKPADRRSGDAATSATEDSRKKEPRTAADKAAVPTAEQARKTDPTANTTPPSRSDPVPRHRPR